MTVSAVIPTYNYARFLPQAIDSVLCQSAPPLEVIVADDGSSDNTAEVVSSYGDKVRYVRYDHSGVYAVRQAILLEIRGDWFFNLDADNVVEADFVEKNLEAIALAPQNCAFVYPDRVTFGAYVRHCHVPEFDMALFKKRNFVDMNSFVKTSVARAMGFDPAFNDGWGDYDFFLRIAKSGYMGVAQHQSPLHYRIHSASITAATEKSLDKKHDLMQRMVNKHTDFFTKEDAVSALKYYSRAAARRSHVYSLFLERRYLAAVGRLLAYHFKLFG